MTALLVLVQALAVSLSFTKAGAVEAATPVTLGTPFTLAVNGAAIVEDIGLIVRFDAVTSDSRCPVEVACVWAGVATVDLVVGRENRPPTTLTLDTLEATGEAEGFTFSLLRLDPPASVNVRNPDYVALFRIDPANP
jgi:hypothetical protein